MNISDGFELIDIAGEYIAVPVGKRAESFQGVVVLAEAAAFLLEHMKKNMTIDELVELLVNNYDVNRERALIDISEMLKSLKDMGLITDC